MSRNDEIARLLEEFAALLSAKGVEYKPRAYRRAAENIREHPGAVEALAAKGEDALGEIDGVGDAIASKVVEYVETGEIGELEDLREEYPIDIAAITSVEGVGPKTAGTLYEELGVRDLDDLEAAAEAGEIREVSGFGEKTERNIAESIEFARQATERQLLGEARPYGESVVEFLEGTPGVGSVELAGSLRRWRATIGDVDVLVGSDDAETVIDAFTAWPEADGVIEAGDVKASVRAGGVRPNTERPGSGVERSESAGVRIDLRVVVPEEFGSALQYFTGSKEHNVAVRNRAIERDVKINEYGAFDVSGIEDDSDQRAGERIAGETEASMYDALGMAWVPPELRENRGEVEAAMEGTLPDLVEPGDVRGDLHTHTAWSDGSNTIGDHVAAAAEFGHDYVAVTDHATGPGMVGGVGVDDAELREEMAEIREVAESTDIDVFAGVEANVGTGGSISVADDLLADLDLVVASPHAGLDGDGTDRLVEAASHPGVDVIGHPTGRMLNQRSGLDVDVERLATAAAEHGTALEINANPSRLDLAGGAVKTAVEAGATIAVNTDAHSPAGFELIRYGVHTARRGWAEPGDVLNARDAAGVRAFLGE